MDKVLNKMPDIAPDGPLDGQKGMGATDLVEYEGRLGLTLPRYRPLVPDWRSAWSSS